MPVQLSASSAPFTATQVPPPPVHVWHAAHEAPPQQRPSTQLPLVHSVAAVQVCPLTLLHAPVASHDCMPLHMSSLADFTALHVPISPARLHAREPVAHALAQQYPSAQKPLVHSVAAAQVCPLPFFARHLPPAQ